MTPIKHDLCNTVLKRPPGMTEEECGDLHIMRAENAFGIPDGPSVNSFWMPEPNELAALNAGSPIVMHVCGNTHPPCCLLVLEPGPDAPPIRDEITALKNRLAMAEAARDEWQRRAQLMETWKAETTAIVRPESPWKALFDRLMAITKQMTTALNKNDPNPKLAERLTNELLDVITSAKKTTTPPTNACKEETGKADH